MITIRLKGREIPLIYTVLEMKQIQEEIGPLARAIDMILGWNPDDKEDISRFGSAEHIENAAKMIRILGNAGLEEAGENADLTERKIMRAMKPAEMLGIINACMEAMNEGMASEIPKPDQKGPVDETLEEINKKKERNG